MKPTFVAVVLCLAGVTVALGQGSADPQVATLFVQEMADGKIAEAHARFEASIRSEFPVAGLSDAWNQVIATSGAFVRLGKYESLTTGDGVMVTIPAFFAQDSAKVSVFVTKRNEVGGFVVRPWQVAEAPGPVEPPYADRASFYEEEISLGRDPFILTGTLSLPLSADRSQRKSNVPAVVLLHGSGPNDRDETLGPNKPLRDVAWGLASKGVAVLRYDKRTRSHGDLLDPLRVTIDEEVLEDAQLGIDLLLARPEVDPKRIYVLGHSLGATVAPLVAAGRPSLAGIVMLCAAARPFAALMDEQLRYLASMEPDSMKARQLREYARQAREVMSPTATDSTMVLGLSAHYARDLERRDPVGTAARLAVPMLFIQGGRDFQVTMQDFDIWQNRLGQHDNVTFRLYSDLNHILQSGSGASTPAEYQKPGNVDPRVIDEVARFMLEE